MSDESDRLAGFHRTISDQLNARLVESPRFFWALVAVSAGYGYVLTKQDLAQNATVFNLASALSYISVLWAAWYLAALGYAFRFLQNGQHCIERALRWNTYVPVPGEPPDGVCNSFWLLPGIYHAHAAGLIAFLVTAAAAFCVHWRQNGWAITTGSILFLVGLAFIVGINRHYLRRFKERRLPPDTIQPLSGA